MPGVKAVVSREPFPFVQELGGAFSRSPASPAASAEGRRGGVFRYCYALIGAANAQGDVGLVRVHSCELCEFFDLVVVWRSLGAADAVRPRTLRTRLLADQEATVGAISRSDKLFCVACWTTVIPRLVC